MDVAKRFWSKVSIGDSDVCWTWEASLRSQGRYGQFWFEGKIQYAHRVAYQLVYGAIPPGLEIDHTCRLGRCVNPKHLRLATHKQNNENRAGAHRNNKCGVRGVSPSLKRWEARVYHNRSKIYLGAFDTPEEAGEAAKAKRLELFTHNDADREP